MYQSWHFAPQRTFSEVLQLFYHLGQLGNFKAMQATVSMIAIDEAHKIFNRMPSCRPAFDEMQQLKE